MTTRRPVRYRSPDEDSARWEHVALRPGDVVVSARSKSGTTWTQFLCLLLVHQTPDLPAPLPALSPWVDWLGEPVEDVVAGLDAQPHRRVVKTHTPLDGLPLDPAATYVVIARHPLDAAVSLHHQSANLDRTRIAQLLGSPAPDDSADEREPSDLHDWLVRWIDAHADPREALDSLPGYVHHATDAWSRREAANVVLLHYDDLLADLPGQARRLAAALGIDVPADRWPALLEAAGFARMRQRADVLAPAPDGVLRDRRAFFRSGRSGEGRAVLSAAELDRYRERVATLAPPDVLAWLHHESPTLPGGAERVAAALAAAGVPGSVRVLPEPAPTATAAAAQLGCDVGAIANSLVFEAVFETDRAPLLVLTSGAHRVDTDRVARQVGASRVRRATPELVRAATGQPIGGVAPVGHPAPVRTLVDTWLQRHEQVWAAGGHPSTVFPTTFDELVRVTGGTPADVG